MVHRSSAIPNLVGHSIDNGRLKFTAILGNGSNGLVFLAVDTTSPAENPTKYAVKCVPKADKGSRRYGLQRQEISNHKKASVHTNVLKLHRVVKEGSFLFLVLDYCPGGDLFQFIFDRRITPGDDALVKRLFLQIIDVLDACHNMGIFHRDMKPENILCSEDGSKIYLCDFGLSTRKPFSVTFGAGSSYYMSPECIGQDDGYKAYCTRANDVWALGVILTAMISGHNPWRRATCTDACYLAYVRDPTFLLKTLPISSSANSVLQRIFTADPGDRITIPFLRLMILQTDTFFANKLQPSRLINSGKRGHVERLLMAKVGFHRTRPDESLSDDGTLAMEKFKMGVVSLPAMDAKVAPRNFPMDCSLGKTASKIGSKQPVTLELSFYEPLSDIPVCLQTGGNAHFVVAAKGLSTRRTGSKLSRGVFRRIANRLYLSYKY